MPIRVLIPIVVVVFRVLLRRTSKILVSKKSLDIGL
jgi:hypothetical protein